MTAQTDKLAQVSSGLNLWLELDPKADMDELMGKLFDARARIGAALDNLHYVHFSRFLPSRDGKALLVITEFDGDFDAYVLDFVLAIGDEFEMIMGYVRNRPPKPVKDYPTEFLQFVKDNNVGYGQSGSKGVDVHCAYPQRTVIDIVGASGMAPAAHPPEAVVVDRKDVQANILRGIAASNALHVGLGIGDPAGACAMLNELLTGSNGAPLLGNDGDWPKGPNGAIRPAYALTLGFTYAGLVKLGITASDQTAFYKAHHAFFLGPAYRETAIKVGDVGPSEPAEWQLGGAFPVDMVVSIYADDPNQLNQQHQALLLRCQAHALSVVNHPWPAQALADEDDSKRRYLHFGYADGMAQPRLAIDGALDGDPDMQPKAGVGEILLGAGYLNVFGGSNSLGGLSPDLAQNATFAALRIMEQDVDKFEALLDHASATHGVDREWLAAKLMGRWRDGTPLVQSPDQPLPEAGAPPRNQFDYLPSIDNPSSVDDSEGLRCPVGAHARRMNPRSAKVAGRPHSRRLLRRGMPYGPKFEPGSAGDGQSRGLVGLFLCADLDRQFEFILAQWAQGDHATSGLVGQQDPIIGAQANPQDGSSLPHEFRIPMPVGTGDIVLKMPRLVKTIGSAYLFMPGLAGVGYLAKLVPAGAAIKPLPSFAAQLKDWHSWKKSVQLLGAGVLPPAAPPPPNPATFDPRTKDFRDNPFLAYAWFRDHQPMANLPVMGGTWVFSHKHVAMIAGDQTRFHKRISTANTPDPSPTGLLNMDPPPHLACRNAIQPLFDAALNAVAPTILATVAKFYRANCQNKGALDLMVQFAQPVAQAVFFDVFGVSVADASTLIDQVNAPLATVSPKDDPANTAVVSGQLQNIFVTLLMSLETRCKTDRLFHKILAGTNNVPFDAASNTWIKFVRPVHVEQLAISATLALAGFLPLQWFIALASWHLLENNGALLQQIKNNPAITNRAVVDELLRFDMSPPMSVRYVVNNGTVVDGTTFNKDQRLMLCWASASRDEAQFGPHADTIDFTRNKGPGWAFGDAGQHHCMGSEMVYMVMQPVIQTLRGANPMPKLDPTFVPTWGTPADHAMFRRMSRLNVIC